MRTLLTLMSLAVGLYIGLGLLLYLFQGRMVFLANLPGRALTATPADVGLDYEDVTITTSDGEGLHGWLVPGRKNGVRVHFPERHGVADVSDGKMYSDPIFPDPTLLFFHGNAGNISHRLESLEIFHRLGLTTLIVDYRGYGQSTGSPSEEGTYRDARAAWDWLVGERGIEPGRIVVFGRSLGGAVGAWLASRDDVDPAGVIIESAFSSGVDMARELYPVFPAGLMTRLRYPVIDYVQDIEAPVLVVHSRDDEIIPFAMGRKIYEAASEPKSFLELGGGHNTGFLVSGEAYVTGLEEFVASVLD